MKSARKRKYSITSILGLVLVGANVLVALFAGQLAPHGEADVVGLPWAFPSAEFPLGLDNLGRDMLSRLAYGARTSITIALLICVLSFAIGVTLGFAAVIAKGSVDAFLSRIVDVIMSIPTLILCLIILSVMGTSTPVLVLTVAILDSTRVFRLSRAVGQEIVAMEYVEVARLRGEGVWWIMRREVLPNAFPTLVAELGLRFCFAFLFVASLSFLGLGVQPPNADWGGMVRDNAGSISFGSLAPLIPAIAIGQLTVSVNLVVDWVLSRRNRINLG